LPVKRRFDVKNFRFTFNPNFRFGSGNRDTVSKSFVKLTARRFRLCRVGICRIADAVDGSQTVVGLRLVEQSGIGKCRYVCTRLSDLDKVAAVFAAVLFDDKSAYGCVAPQSPAISQPGVCVSRTTLPR